VGLIKGRPLELIQKEKRKKKKKRFEDITKDLYIYTVTWPTWVWDVWHKEQGKVRLLACHGY